MLTDKAIRALKATGRPYRKPDGDRSGFGVQVSAKGAKAFYLQYTFKGQRRFENIGRYPDLTLAEGRESARKLRQEIAAYGRQGIDPRHAWSRQARERAKRGSVRDLLNAYLAHCRKKDRRPSWLEQTDRLFEKHVFPVLGADAPAADVEPADVARIIAPLAKAGKERQADIVRSTVHAAFEVGLKSDLDPRRQGAARFALKQNPATPVPRMIEGALTRDRHLTFEEIRRVWWEIEATGCSPVTVALIRLALALGGQRFTELREAEWAEFDLEAKVWTLPRERTKTRKRDHLVPIGGVALGLLRELRLLTGRSRYVFPKATDYRAPMPAASLPQSVRRMLRWMEAQGSPMEPWRPGDIRRTVKTRMAEIGVPKPARDTLQNHALNDVAQRHYDRYEDLPTKRQAIRAWDIALAAAVQGDEIPVAQARAAFRWQEGDQEAAGG